MDRDRKDQDLPHRAPQDLEEMEREAERSRKAEEKIPPPGTDPLHEGP